jgi:transposase
MPAACTSRSANPSPLPTRRTACEEKGGSEDLIALKDAKYLLVVQYIRHGTSKIVFICSDMWEPYLKTICEKYSEALHVLDRFHIVAKINKALDEVRAG